MSWPGLAPVRTAAVGAFVTAIQTPRFEYGMAETRRFWNRRCGDSHIRIVGSKPKPREINKLLVSFDSEAGTKERPDNGTKFGIGTLAAAKWQQFVAIVAPDLGDDYP
jgi:hypothetical protein